MIQRTRAPILHGGWVLSAALCCGQAAAVLHLDYEVARASAPSIVDHHQSVVLEPGFVAAAGLDMVFAINEAPGVYVDKTPLGAEAQRYTRQPGRRFVVAGCLPAKVVDSDPNPGGITASWWHICNDLDWIKDKVVDSPFISCLDHFPNGVLAGAEVREKNFRTWESMRISCRELSRDGRLAAPTWQSDYLIDFGTRGRLHAASWSDVYLPYGIKEYWKSPKSSSESLASFALLRGPAQSLADGEQLGADGYWGQSNVIPDYPPFLPLTTLNTSNWSCPPGMIATGAAVGHIPDGKRKDTRPTHILLECRRLWRAP